MGTAGAIITLLGGVLTLILWLFKRKQDPTPQQRKDDVEREYSDTIETIHKLRSQGKHVAADEMLRRLQQQHTPVVVCVPPGVSDTKSTGINPSPAIGKLMADRPASGLAGDNQ